MSIVQLVQKFLAFMQPKGSLPCREASAIGYLSWDSWIKFTSSYPTS